MKRNAFTTAPDDVREIRHFHLFCGLGGGADGWAGGAMTLFQLVLLPSPLNDKGDGVDVPISIADYGYVPVGTAFIWLVLVGKRYVNVLPVLDNFLNLVDLSLNQGLNLFCRLRLPRHRTTSYFEMGSFA